MKAKVVWVVREHLGAVVAGLGEGMAIDKEELKWVIFCAYLRLPANNVCG